MKYFPFEKITYHTKLSPEEVLQVIQKNLETKKLFRMNILGLGDHKPYEGRVTTNSFSIRRVIGYKNSFLPMISGIVEKTTNGTTINITMRLHSFVILFLFLILGAYIIWTAGSILIVIEDGVFNFNALLPIGFLLLGYLLVTGLFKYESDKSKRDLANFFNANYE